MTIRMFMTKYFYLLMSKFNFLGHWVVIQQHTPLDIVEVYLENNKNLVLFFISFQNSGLNLYNAKWLKDSEIRKRLLFYKSSEIISEDYTVIMPTRL